MQQWDWMWISRYSAYPIELVLFFITRNQLNVQYSFSLIFIADSNGNNINASAIDTNKQKDNSDHTCDLELFEHTNTLFSSYDNNNNINTTENGIHSNGTENNDIDFELRNLYDDVQQNSDDDEYLNGISICNEGAGFASQGIHFISLNE